MAHKHSVYDTDSHFSISPLTRAISYASASKNLIMQFDHNSERFTFEMPRYVEEHDMLECTKVEIHYLNGKNPGVYEVADLQKSPDSETVVIFSWLVSQNATQLAGSLSFAIRFTCVAEDGTIDYAWNTDVYTSMKVVEGIYNSDVIVEEYTDVLEQWKNELFSNQRSTDYYSTTREELGVDHENINTDYIFGLYDALMTEYPDNVQKNEVYNDDGTFTNYEYVISTGEYRTDGEYAKVYGRDTQTKKPKYLILSGIHGVERKTVFSVYRFIRDVLSGHNVPKSFVEGVTIRVMPVGNPSGFNAFTRWNDNLVDINRNFDYGYNNGFTQVWYDTDGDNAKDDCTNGTSAASEKETQVIAKWLNDNSDAELFIDLHNSSCVNELIVVLGLPDNDVVDKTKKVAMRGLDRIIPFWRDIIDYDKLDNPYSGEEKKAIIFSNSVCADVKGSAYCYAMGNVGIPSIALEMTTYNGDYSEWLENREVYPPEIIALGAEAIGNILIEFYDQAFFGEVSNEMKEIDNKLGVLAESMASVSKGFRTESGVITLESDLLPAEGETAVRIRIPCSNGAKTLDFHADSDTLATIRKTQGLQYIGSFIGNFFAPNAGQTGLADIQSSYMVDLRHGDDIPQTEKYNYGWVLRAGGNASTTNTDGVIIPCRAIKAGTYEWIAYYWND